jgi:phage terminase Nu1 subunit (DNA packaging protein)
MDPYKLTQPELAQILEKTDRAIRDMDGEPTPIPSSGSHRARRYDLRKVIPWLIARALKKAEVPEVGVFEEADVAPYKLSEARKMAADADLAEQKAARDRGELLHILDYERAWAVRIQRHKEGMVAIKARLSTRVGPSVAAIVDDEIRAVLGAMDEIQIAEGA